MFARRSNNLDGELTDFISETIDSLTTGYVALQQVKAEQAKAQAAAAAAQTTTIRAAQAQVIPGIPIDIPWNLVLLGGGAIAAVYLLTKKKR